MSAQSPRALCIDLAREREIHIIVDRKVIAAVAEIEPKVVVVAERRKNHSARIFFREREITERQSQRERHIRKHHIGRSGHHILVGAHLGAGKLEIKVGMLVIVACGVLAVFDIERPVVHPLGTASLKEALVLLGDDSGYVSALCLEVIFHRLGLIFARLVLEHGATLRDTGGIHDSGGIDRAAVEFHADLSRVKLEILIFDCAVTVKIRIVETFEHKRIFCRERDCRLYIDLRPVNA